MNPLGPGAGALSPAAVPGGSVDAGAGVVTPHPLAFAPQVTRDDAVRVPGLLPDDADIGLVPRDVRAQLGAVKLSVAKIGAIFQAAERFNRTIRDGRSVDELSLGLLWMTEGAARLSITLDPANGVFAGAHRNVIGTLVSLGAYPEDSRRAWRVTNIGLWGFGLDDICAIYGGGLAEWEWANSEKRWKSRLRDHAGWTHGVPFLSVTGSTDPPVVTSVRELLLSYTATEAVGFLVTVAARFTYQLWQLPARLAERGILLSTDRVEEIPQVEPVLAYLCYLSNASRAAGVWQALIFLLEFSGAVARATTELRDGGSYYLTPVIDVLNRWRVPLHDHSSQGLLQILANIINDATVRVPGGVLGRHVLAKVVGRADWDPIPPPLLLDAAGVALLESLVDAWIPFARRLAELKPGPGQHEVTPGELFYQGADDASGAILFASRFGTLGFGARNYGRRFQTATGEPLGGRCTRTDPRLAGEP